MRPYSRRSSTTSVTPTKWDIKKKQLLTWHHFLQGRNRQALKRYLKIITQCFNSASFSSLLFDLIDSSNSSLLQLMCNRHIPHCITVLANITFVPKKKQPCVIQRHDNAIKRDALINARDQIQNEPLQATKDFTWAAVFLHLWLIAQRLNKVLRWPNTVLRALLLMRSSARKGMQKHKTNMLSIQRSFYLPNARTFCAVFHD